MQKQENLLRVLQKLAINEITEKVVDFEFNFSEVRTIFQSVPENPYVSAKEIQQL